MERITVKDAATILGVSEQYVRVGMQRGWLPIGSCVKLSSKWTYHIPEERLMAYLEGRDIKNPAATGEQQKGWNYGKANEHGQCECI